jgi:hypothetical protein
LHTATHHPAHHSTTLSTRETTTARSAKATASGSALPTWEATASGATLTAWEAAALSTLATKARTATLLSALTLLARKVGSLCLSSRIDGPKSSRDERTKCDTGNHLLIHGNSPENQQWEFVAFTTWPPLPMT